MNTAMAEFACEILSRAQTGHNLGSREVEDIAVSCGLLDTDYRATDELRVAWQRTSPRAPVEMRKAG